MKTILKVGIIFAVIYGALLLILTLYTKRLMPAELDIIVPLWLLIKSQIVKMTVALPSPYFLSIMVAMQAIAAFIQGAVIGLAVNVIKNRNNRI